MGKLLIKRKQRVSSKRNIYFSSYSRFIAHPYALEQNPISLFINLIDEIQICWRMSCLYFTTSTQESFSLVLIEWLPLRNFLHENMLAKLKDMSLYIGPYRFVPNIRSVFLPEVI